MRVTRLSVTDFRSYPELDLDLGPGTTTLVGPNGAGKTNIVEAVRYLSTLSSHRSAGDAPLIRAGASAAVVRGKVEKSGRVLVVETTIAPGKRRGCRLNGAPAKPRDVIGVLRSVIFSPEDLELVKGDPASRRRMVDDVCVALSPAIAGDLADYDRIVRQRTALLKSVRGTAGALSTLDVWDERLASAGAAIVRARLDAVAALTPHLTEAYRDISDGGSCSAAYAASFGEGDLASRSEDEIAGALAEALARQRVREIERGVCLAGPHRDDVEIRVGDLPARGYASHGESWSCALALRLATYDLLTADGGPDSDADGEPVLVLDDVFAELDFPRREALAARIGSAQQVLVTAAVAGDVPKSLAGTTFRVEPGGVVARGA